MAEVLNAFYLADWYVDSSSNRLCRGETEVRLESRMMAVLTYLAQHRGELVTRETLEQAVWGDAVVGYDALTGCIAKLRKVLGDDPRHPRYIETISKKGYRLIGNISREAPRADSASEAGGNGHLQKPLWRLTVAILILGLVLTAVFWPLRNEEKAESAAQIMDRPSIVVLPFTNIGNEAGRDYFSDGITADINTALSKLSGLFVISQSSAANWRDSLADSRQFAGSLGVRYVLEGSVRRSGERLRINVHLVDAASDVYLWSEKYDRELRNVFAVQDDITAHIVNTLSVKLTQEEKRRTAQRYTSRIDAYDDYLRGHALYSHHTREDNLSAREYYQRAIDRDSGFARAYSSMALTYVAEHRYGWTQDSPSQLDKALKLAKKGVALDNELPQAHWVLAYVNVFRQAYQQAAEAAQRAIELEPNFADSYVTLAVCKMHFGESKMALRLLRKAMLLNPKYPAAYASVQGQIHFVLREYEQAVPMLREAIERNVNLLTPHVFLIVALSKLERPDEAAWEAGQLKTIAPNFTSNSIIGMLPIQDVDIIEDMQKHLQRLGI